MNGVLVVGGAGYIGSHTCLNLSQRGFTPIVYDNLVNGHREFAKWGPFEFGDVRDRERLDQVLSSYKPVAIVHLAGLIDVGLSVKKPIAFFDSNLAGSTTLFAAAMQAGIDKLVFSSTCATYGIPLQVPIREDHPQAPINPYGKSKLMVEQILKELQFRNDIRSVILRYFNAAGADPQGRIGEWHTPETHLIPLTIASVQSNSALKIFGTDYPTRDGTCIRDFIHVCDIAEAHGRGIDHLLAGGESVALNLGTGRGTSVSEIIEAVRRISGKEMKVELCPRREGDPPELVADNALAKATLGWRPTFDLESIIESAWNWHQKMVSRLSLGPEAPNELT